MGIAVYRTDSAINLFAVTLICAASQRSQEASCQASITIGIFGLDNAGKTSVVKAIGGVPTTRVTSTINSTTTNVAYPSPDESDRPNKDSKGQKRIQVIDVSGERKYRQDSWSNYYDQLHGLIFVIDASERRRLNETRDTLTDLLGTEHLSGKPVLILANKQDRPDAIDDESEVKRKLDLKTVKSKFRVELCTAWPQDGKNKVDTPIRDGWFWLIRAIEDNYNALNSRIMRTKKAGSQKQLDRSGNDENNRDSKRSGYPSAINTSKLPSIHARKNLSDDDDDDVHSSALNNSLKKKKVLGASTGNNLTQKSSNNQHPIPFRSTYEPFPEEMPWSNASIGKSAKFDDHLLKVHSKPPMGNSTRKRDVSPLVHDTKPPAYGSSTRNHYVSDDDDGDGLSRYPKTNPTSRFDQPSFGSSRLSATAAKKQPSDPGYYDDTYYKANSKAKTSRTYDSDDEKSNRTLYNNEYRSGPTKATKASRFDDEDDDDYSLSTSNTRAPYNSLRASSATPKPTTRSTYNDYDRSPSSSKQRSQSKFDDDDYLSPPSKPLANSRSYGKNDDDDYDDDDNGYSKSTHLARASTLSKTNYYSSSYDDHQTKPETNGSRTRFDEDDYSATKNRSTTGSRFRSNNLYDD